MVAKKKKKKTKKISKNKTKVTKKPKAAEQLASAAIEVVRTALRAGLSGDTVLLTLMAVAGAVLAHCPDPETRAVLLVRCKRELDKGLEL